MTIRGTWVTAERGGPCWHSLTRSPCPGADGWTDRPRAPGGLQRRVLSCGCVHTRPGQPPLPGAEEPVGKGLRRGPGPRAPWRMDGAWSSHRDLVRGPPHAGNLLNQRVPGGAGGGPWGAGSRPQPGQAWGLPVKLTWGGLQLRVVPASKQAHTRTHTVSTGPRGDGGRWRRQDR